MVAEGCGECGESFCSFRLEAYFCSKSVFTSIVVLCTNGCIITIFFFFSRRSIMVMILMRKLAILSTFLLAIVSFQTADASLTRVPKKPAAPDPSEKTAKRTTRAAPGETCDSWSACDAGYYCRDYDYTVGTWGSSGPDVCVSCTDATYPCNFNNAVGSNCGTCSTSNSENTGSPSMSDLINALTSVQTCSIAYNACFSAPECNIYSGSCNVVVKKTDQWCDDFCFAESKDDCCEINPGPVAGIAIGSILLIVFAIVGCCACCRCCCFQRRQVMADGGQLVPVPPNARVGTRQNLTKQQT